MNRFRSGAEPNSLPRFSGRLLTAWLILCFTGAGLRAAPNIFDDDWTPPKPAAPKPADVPSPNPPAPATPPPSTTPPVTPSPAIPGTRPAGPADATKPPVPRPSPPVVAKPNAAKPDAVAGSAGRRAVPDSQALARSRRLMREVFSKELSDRSAAGRQALAKRLLDEAAKAAEVPADQFTMLIGAIDAASEGASVKLTLQAADRTAAAFDVDVSPMKVEALHRISSKRPSPTLSAAELADVLNLTRNLLNAEDYLDAQRVVASVRPMAGDAASRDALAATAKEIADAKAAQDRLAFSLERLKTSPNDPAANLVVGMHYCFRKREWTRGLPLLAKGSDPALASAAKADLSEPRDGESQARLGDDWLQAAGKLPKDQKVAAQERAEHWYVRALPQATGLQRAAIKKHLKELPGSIDFEQLAALSAAGEEKTAMVGKVQAGGQTAMPPSPGMLVGFDYTLGNWKGHHMIKSLVLTFATAQGKATTRTYGNPNKGAEPKNISARPGYAVGAILADGSDRLNGFKVVFMRVHGAALDVEDSYESEWIGGTTQPSPEKLGGDGRPVIAAKVVSGADVDAIALVQVKDKP